MKTIDLVGQRFGNLIVERRSFSDGRGEARWLCRCVCGKTTEVLGSNLRTNHTKSCGCLRSRVGSGNFKHGKYGLSVYNTWSSMMQRCCNPNNPFYSRYGGRGIVVCESWKVFDNFYNDMGDKPRGYTLERIDNNVGYCKVNCKWASKKEQARNRCSSLIISYNGVSKTLVEWAEVFSIGVVTLWKRIYTYNWPLARAFNEPVKRF